MAGISLFEWMSGGSIPAAHSLQLLQFKNKGDYMNLLEVKRQENKARRTAQKVGLIARKSRSEDFFNNEGGFQLTDENNCLVAGSSFDLSSDEVIEYCRD